MQRRECLCAGPLSLSAHQDHAGVHGLGGPQCGVDHGIRQVLARMRGPQADHKVRSVSAPRGGCI